MMIIFSLKSGNDNYVINDFLLRSFFASAERPAAANKRKHDVSKFARSQ